MKQICRIYKYSYLSINRLEKLRNLTINNLSGMNHILTELRWKRSYSINIDAFVIVLYENKEAIGWALISKEPTSFWKTSEWTPSMGYFMQIFVDENHRHKGAASKIIEKCNKHIESKIWFADISVPSIFDKLKDSESIW